MPVADLPPAARLRRPSEFAALRSSSGRASGRCFFVRFRHNELGLARMGLAISKRVSKRAVERNRIKRLVRESFRRIRHQLPPVDMMVMARERVTGMTGAELLEELEGVWKQMLAGYVITPAPEASRH